jgi:uncharacterized membrane protein YfcA
MERLLVLALIGLVAQLVDGSMGMGYGLTSASLLLAAGFSPAVASATIHVAKIATGLVSGAAHWRFGNVDWGVVRRLALPGAIGAFAGATVLSHIPAEIAKPFVAALLFALGLVVLVRFGFFGGVAPAIRGNLSNRFLARPWDSWQVSWTRLEGAVGGPYRPRPCWCRAVCSPGRLSVPSI